MAISLLFLVCAFLFVLGFYVVSMLRALSREGDPDVQKKR